MTADGADLGILLSLWQPVEELMLAASGPPT